MNKLLLGSLTLALMASVAMTAQADPIHFLFTGPNADLGAAVTYTAGTSGLSVFASGFSSAGKIDLWGKNKGYREQGLGLTNDTSGENEITPGSYVQLEVQQLFGKVDRSSIMFGFQSTTNGETYAVYGSNTSGSVGRLLTSGTDQGTNPLPDFTTYRYYDFGSLKGNVLLHEVSANQVVPEPASMALVGVGLIGLGCVRRRAVRA